MINKYINPILIDGEDQKDLGMWDEDLQKRMLPQLKELVAEIEGKEVKKTLDTKAIVEKLEEPLKPKITKIPPVEPGMHPCGLSDKEVEKIREAKELGLKNLKDLYKSIGDKLNISTTIAKEKFNQFEGWKEKVRNGQHSSQNITGF